MRLPTNGERNEIMAKETRTQGLPKRGDAATGTNIFEPVMRAAQQRIIISDLTVACRIGVTDKERANHQRLRINLILDVRPSPPRLDRIGEVVDYGALATKLREVCSEAEFRLLESLAGQLASMCFEDKRVERAHVRIDKLDRYADMAAIGCEATYERGRG